MVDVDVLIVGAGPVGLMLANQLGQRGIRVLQVERNASTVHEPRAIGYDDETCRAMQMVGLSERFADHIVEDLPFAILDRRGNPLIRIQVADRPYGHSWIGTFYQPTLERMLAENLDRFPSVDLRFEHALVDFAQDGEGVRAIVHDARGRPLEVRSRWLVGCDGGASGVRRTLGVRFRGTTYRQRWLVVDCRNDPYGRQEMTFLSDPARPTVTLPAPGGRRRWEFLLHRGETAEAMTRPETVARLLAPHHDPAVADIERATVYTFHARAARRFRVGRVLLAGDAAHVMPPFAGQGMNSGIRDAVNLGWKLALVVAGDARPSLVDSYDRERRWHVARMTRVARFLGWLLMPTHRLHEGLRNAVIAGFGLFPRTHRLLHSGELRPAPHLGRHGLVVGGGPSGGAMLPQVDVLGEDGARRPLDAFLGTGFAVVGVDVDPLRRPDAWSALASRLGASSICIHTSGTHPLPSNGPTQHVVDPSGTFAAFADRDLLIRPDRFVMADVVSGTRAATAARVTERLALEPPIEQRTECAS